MENLENMNNIPQYVTRPTQLGKSGEAVYWSVEMVIFLISLCVSFPYAPMFPFTVIISKHTSSTFIMVNMGDNDLKIWLTLYILNTVKSLIQEHNNTDPE